MSYERSGFPLGLMTLGALIGMLVCGLSYWPVVFELQQKMKVQPFPPGGLKYWFCWLLPLGVVAVVFIPLALAWRSGRSVMLSFAIAFLFVGGALCMFGYSIDNMPNYM
ncbi:hypothetical protein [Rhodococcus erythropolis]|uniref:hypothetical protein n=1 Tax=Rhodococcus erythropolis TaxID=1833 RepID=UPI001F37859E|nr:hypothetical protein [Rhodococcus erythropolis]